MHGLVTVGVRIRVKPSPCWIGVQSRREAGEYESWGNTQDEVAESGAEKSAGEDYAWCPYRKPTQVGGQNMVRRAG
jgi:hypothetical protein